MSWLESWCDRCRAYHRPESHHPTWVCWCPEWHDGKDEGRLVRARDAEQAAERFIESDDDTDELVDSTVEVVVETPDGPVRFDVEVRIEIRVSATRREPDEQQ